MRRGAANILLFAAAFALAVAAVTLLSGGFAWPAAGVSSRDPWRPFLAALALAAAARGLIDRDRFRRALRRGIGTAATLPARVAAAASACLLVFAIAWTSRAAGGSDSSCYVLQAEAFAAGHAALANPVAAALPGLPAAAFAPAGFIASPRAYGEAVPICAPGLALAMALAERVHPGAVFLVVPISAALLVWLTFLYGRHVDRDVTGACAAALVACSPIVLYQAVQPMSDIPAATAWMAALVGIQAGGRRGAVLAGLAASAAVLVRPNLALLVLPLAAVIAFGPGRGPAVRSDCWRLPAFLLAMTPGTIVLLWLDAIRYGSPLATGYGAAGGLFAWSHVAANAPRYARWMIETETPFVLLAAAAPWASSRAAARSVAASLLGVLLLVATYLAYTVFDDWWYLRFLLPALPVVVALSVTVLRSLAARLPRPAGAIALAGVCAALGGWHVHVARARHVTELQALESRFVVAGAYAARALPAGAVTLAGQQSGSLRVHGGRQTLSWDALPPGSLDATVAALQRQGRRVYLALEDDEEPRFRARFAGQRRGALDWPPLAQIEAPVRVRFYDAAQQDAYQRGDAVATAFVRR